MSAQNPGILLDSDTLWVAVTMWSKNLRVPIILTAGGSVVVLLSAFTAPTGCLDYVLRHASLYSRIRRALGMFAAIL